MSIQPSTTSSQLRATFEEAITATGFGKFNFLFYIYMIPATWSTVFQVTTMSFVFPVAQCDLDLSLRQKGSLNAITFIGMVTGGFIWGYLSDTFGRKKIFVFGYLFDGITVVICSLSQNYTSLLVTKFIGGAFMNGPFSCLVVYVAELHSTKYRIMSQLLRGAILTIGLVILPLLGWAFLPHKLDVNDYKGSHFILHSWNFYILVTATPSLICGVCSIFMPESPKYLMSIGKTDEALKVFQLIYSMNSGKDKSTYPIGELVDESILLTRSGQQITKDRTKTQALKESFSHIKILCVPPHIVHLLLVCCIQMCIYFSLNTLRLWIPQIFHEISIYRNNTGGSDSSLCNMIRSFESDSNTNTSACIVSVSNSIYQNTAIVSSLPFFLFLIVALTVHFTGEKKMLCKVVSFSNIFLDKNILFVVILAGIGGVCGMGLYFASSTLSALILSSIFVAVGIVATNILVTTACELFPTTLRTVTVALLMMAGRFASAMGNFLFPLLVILGCAPAFFTVGILQLCGTALVFFLPDTDKKPLD